MAGVSVSGDPIAQLRSAAFGLLDAAEKDGIADDMALATWVQSQHTSLLVLADTMEFLIAFVDKSMARALENTRELAVAEVRRLQKANDVAGHLAEKLKAEREVLKLRSEQVVGEFMKSVTPQVVDALKMVTVIKQRRWNARQNLLGVCILLGGILGLFGGGYIVGGGDFQGRSSGAAAQAAVDRCRAAAQADRATGAKWCPLSVLEGGDS